MKTARQILQSPLFFFSLLIFCSPIRSAAQWIQQPFPSTETLWKVRFFNESTGWILGGLGHLYKTTDSGTSWTEMESWDGGGWTLYTIGEDTVLHTRWLNQAPYPNQIRRTTDGGLTWETVDSLAENVFYDEFAFVNDRTGFVVGRMDTGNGLSGFVRRTIDAGRTWTTLYVAVDLQYEFTGASFIDELNGWIGYYFGKVFRTTDGGYSWTELTSYAPPGGGPTRDIQFTSPDSGWTVGGIGGNLTVSRTTDGGATWTYYTVSGGSSLREIEMLDSQRGWFVGSVNLPPYIGQTTDGGDSWSEQELAPENLGGFESLSMVNENVGWAVGSNGYVYKTTNGGVTLVDDQAEFPLQFRLDQNYPNPFNPLTTFQFTIVNRPAPWTGSRPDNSRDGQSTILRVYDLLGREVATLVNEELPPGTYTRQWDASEFSSGVYFYRLKAGKYVATRKLVLLR